MIVNSNKELSDAINQLIKESGYKKTFIAEKLGMTRQGLDKLLKKQSFSFDDANKILAVLHKKLYIHIENE